MNTELAVALDGWKEIRKAIGFPVLRPLPSPAGSVVASAQRYLKAFGIYLPIEYTELVGLYNGEKEPAPFFHGIPFRDFRQAFAIFKASVGNDGVLDPCLWSLSEEDGAGLYIAVAKKQVTHGRVYYCAHGIRPMLEFDSIASLLGAIDLCWKAGSRGVVGEMPFGKERERQDQIFRSLLKSERADRR